MSATSPATLLDEPVQAHDVDGLYRRAAKILDMGWDEITGIFGDTPEEREKLWPAFERWFCAKRPEKQQLPKPPSGRLLAVMRTHIKHAKQDAAEALAKKTRRRIAKISRRKNRS
jgi:hypothetical protein